MKLIQLTNCDKQTVVDDEDFEKLNKRKWRLGKHNYVMSGGAYNSVYIHRVILGLSDKPNRNNKNKRIVVDHINNNPLDNLRSNLRVIDENFNPANKQMRKTNKWGYKGVYYNKKCKRFIAEIRKDGKKYQLGSFLDAKSAGMAYNKKAIELYGNNIRINNII